MTRKSILESKRNWYHKNRQLQLLKKKQYREKNAESIREYKKEWNKKNMKHIVEYNKSILDNLGIDNNSLLLWSKTVKLRDNYKCQVCGNKGQISHHILHKAKYPKLSLVVNNGITLCRWCHAQVHNWSSVR